MTDDQMSVAAVGVGSTLTNTNIGNKEAVCLIFFFFLVSFFILFIYLNRSSKMVYVCFKGMCFISALKSSWDSCQNSEIFYPFFLFFSFFLIL